MKKIRDHLNLRVFYYWVDGSLKNILYALHARIFRQELVYEKFISCVNQSVKLRMPSSDTATYRQIFVRKDYALDFSRDPKVIVDAGANIGLAAIYFARRFPKSTVIAIEPEAKNFEQLVDNTSGIENIVTVKAALWNKNQAISVIDEGIGSWGFSTIQKEHSIAIEEVDAITVDQFLENHGLSDVDVLKLDIEGAEIEVFSQTQKWIEKVDTIIAEVHDELRPGCLSAVLNGCPSFEIRWKQGENLVLARPSSDLVSAN